MSETTPSQSLEETLNKTDLGHVIYEKRYLIGAILVAILVGVIGWMSVTKYKASQELKGSELVFNFQNETWEKVKAGQLSTDELISRFSSLDDIAKSSASMISLALEMSKFLAEKGEADKAINLLRGLKAPNDLSKFFVAHQKAVLLETAGKVDEAIAVIEDVKKTKDLLMPAHLELFLGRLYLVKRDLNQAKSIFQSIIDTYPHEEEAKLAKLYLGEIK